MRNLIVSMALMLSVACSPAAASTTAGMCYRIGDSDARISCLARAHKDPSRCYAVYDANQRNLCFIEAAK